MYFFKKIVDIGLTVTFFLLSIYALVVNRIETMLINTWYWCFWESLMKQENRQNELTFWTWLRWAETVWRVHPHNAPILPLPLYIVLVQYIGFLACFATFILGTCLVFEIPLEAWIQDWLKPAKPEMPIDLILPPGEEIDSSAKDQSEDLEESSKEKDIDWELFKVLIGLSYLAGGVVAIGLRILTGY